MLGTLDDGQQPDGIAERTEETMAALRRRGNCEQQRYDKIQT